MFYRFIYFLIMIIATPLFRIRVHGIENTPKDEKYIICANHKSFLDPIFVALAINRQVHFIAKKELFEKIIEYFRDAREKREKLANNLDYVHEILREGKTRASKLAESKMEIVRETVGLYK